MTRVLVFSASCPVPARSGITHRILSILESLRASGHSMVLATIEIPGSERQAALRMIGVEETYSRPYSFLDKKYRGARLRAARLRGRASPAAHGFHVTRGMQNWFGRVAHEVDPDVILVIDSRFGDIMRGVRSDARRILDTIDLESVNERLWTRISEALPQRPIDASVVLPALYEVGADDDVDCGIDGAEAGRFALFDDLLVISSAEASLLSKMGLDVDIHFIPMAMRARAGGDSYDEHPVFVSGPNPFNTQGYLYFLQRILPVIRRAAPEFRLRVTGSCCDEVVPVDGVEHLGFVEDLDELLRNAAYSICPVFAGTGQQIKVIEAMARGRAVVAFQSAARRSPLEHGVNGLVATTAEEFAQLVLRLHASEALRRKLGNAARATIRAEYSIEQQANRLACAFRRRG